MLRRGAVNAVIDATLERLRRFNYIDDAAFARNWAQSRAQNQGYGPARIKRELTTKGIVDWQIDAAVKEIFASENEAEWARKVLQKKFRSENLTESRVLRRAVAYLQRRGYSSNVIFALLGYSIDDSC